MVVIDEDSELIALKAKLKELKEKNKKFDEIESLQEQIKKEKKRLPQSGFIGVVKRIGGGLKIMGNRLAQEANEIRNNKELQGITNNLHKSFIGDGQEIKFRNYYG